MRTAARSVGSEVVLVGILPTLIKSDLELDNMTPNPRYFALNEALTKLRGGDYEFYLKGIDELHLHHDSIMVEACNASFQVRFRNRSHIASSHDAGWNVDALVLRDGSLPDSGACGGCAGAPTFAGLTSATDNDPCADSGVTNSPGTMKGAPR